MKKALILDLDNTIYPAASLAPEVFKDLYLLISEKIDVNEDEFSEIKLEMNRRPFSQVAKQFNFPDELIKAGQDLLRNKEARGPAKPFDHYIHIQNAPLVKFLVTKGFTRLQQSKIDTLGIKDDFIEVHIVDSDKSDNTKRDVFADILKRYNYTVDEVLVIGDDPESEISAGKELGIETFLLDPYNNYPDEPVNYRSKELKAVLDII